MESELVGGKNMKYKVIVVLNEVKRKVCVCGHCGRYIASPSNGNGYKFCYNCGAEFVEAITAKKINNLKKELKL